MRHDAVAFIGITIEKDPQSTIVVIDKQLFELKLNNLFISVPVVSKKYDSTHNEIKNLLLNPLPSFRLGH